MNFKIDKNWKYDIQKLNSSSNEYKIVMNFFLTTLLPLFSCFKTFEVYKVIEKGTAVKVEEKSNNLMLFYGTSNAGANGILQNGFKNSA